MKEPTLPGLNNVPRATNTQLMKSGTRYFYHSPQCNRRATLEQMSALKESNTHTYLALWLFTPPRTEKDVRAHPPLSNDTDFSMRLVTKSSK